MVDPPSEKAGLWLLNAVGTTDRTLTAGITDFGGFTGCTEFERLWENVDIDRAPAPNCRDSLFYHWRLGEHD